VISETTTVVAEPAQLGWKSCVTRVSSKPTARRTEIRIGIEGNQWRAVRAATPVDAVKDSAVVEMIEHITGCLDGPVTVETL
jgi:hypothetical protein